MIIKRSKQCQRCKTYNAIYVEESKNIKGIRIKCECGNIEECISDVKTVTKWKIVK